MQPIENTRKFVQLRLDPVLAGRLEQAARAANRKLPSEIIFRLSQFAACPDRSVFGWAAPEKAEALGQAISLLAGRLADTVGPMTGDESRDKAGTLAMLKIAIAEILDRMGANDAALSADERSFARLIARQFTFEMQRPGVSAHSIGPRPDLEIISALVRAWQTKEA